MKKMISILILILGMMCLLVFVEASSRDEAIKAAPITIYVDDNFTDEPENHKWDTIQEGIDDANESDMVYVYPGTYHESILINKTISLIGEDINTTIIDGVEGIREVVRVETNWVNISGFTLKSRQKGILLNSASNNIITNCTLSDNEYGIYVQDSSKNKITNCNISNNSNYGIQFELSSNNNSIYHNNFIGNANHAYDSCSNYWDNGYPSGGNYWGGWIGIADSNCGENQDLPGSDGIYDGPFNIPENSNKDYYPLTHFFVWDEIPPEIHLNFPENNSIIKPGTTIDFEIDDENLNIVRCSVNEEEYELSPPSWDRDTGDWNDGTYNITIYANDYGRNEIYESFTFTIDGTQPDISLISPENNSVIKLGTIIDFEIDDTYLNITTYTLNEGLPEILSSPYSIDTGSWGDGAYNITIWADDLVGNGISETFRFIIDGTQPDINITGVINGSYYNTNVTIFVNISDAHLNAAENNITLNNASFISGTTVSSEGEHVLYIYGIDTAGNIAQKTITFTIDKTKPSIGVSGVANDAYYNTDVAPVIDVTDTNLNTTSVTLNSNVFINGTTITEENTYTLVIQAIDKAGNTANKTIIFTVDKTEPGISGLIPVTGTKTTENIITVSGKTEPNATVKIDGIEVPVLADGCFSKEITLVKGDNTITITATDHAGNTAIQSIIIERIGGKEERLPDYLIYLISIPLVFVIALIVVIVFLKRKTKKRKIIRCPACRTVFDEKSGKRPLKIKCPKCGVEGILR